MTIRKILKFSILEAYKDITSKDKMNYNISTAVNKFKQYIPLWLIIELKYLVTLCFKDSNSVKRPVFVLGCYRSGTTMLLETLDICSKCCVYHETNNAATKNYRIKADKRIKRLIAISDKEFVVFKPMNDVQYADRFLNVYENVKVIWSYRNYCDVVNSMVKKWGAAEKRIVLGITNGTYSLQGVTDVGERMKPETLALLKTICSEEMSSEDGAALVWYVRNLIYFELKLYDDHSVLLVQYDDLVTNPMKYVKRVFDFISCPFNKEYVKDIHASSVKKVSAPNLNPKIVLLCKKMMVRLNEPYDRQLGNQHQQPI